MVGQISSLNQKIVDSNKGALFAGTYGSARNDRPSLQGYNNWKNANSGAITTLRQRYEKDYSYGQSFDDIERASKTLYIKTKYQKKYDAYVGKPLSQVEKALEDYQTAIDRRGSWLNPAIGVKSPNEATAALNNARRNLQSVLDSIFQ